MTRKGESLMTCYNTDCMLYVQEFDMCAILLIAVTPFSKIEYESEKPAKPVPQPDELNTFQKVMKLRDEANDKGSSPES